MFPAIDFLVKEGTGLERFGTGVEVPENVRNSFGVGEVDLCCHQSKILFVIPFSIACCEGSAELD